MNRHKVLRKVYFTLICILIAFGVFSCDIPFLNLRVERRTLSRMKQNLNQIRTALLEYKEETGAFPSSDEGLSVLMDFTTTLRGKDTIPRYNIGEMIPTDMGVLSPWFIPFVYENRNGLDVAMFTDSPATGDINRHYSVKIDDDIYVSCVGTMTVFRDYHRHLLRLIGELVLYFSVFALLVVLYRRESKLSPPTTEAAADRRISGKVIAIILTVLATSILKPSCYAMASFSGIWRRPAMLPQYKQLIEKYRERGILSNAAVEKLYSAMDKAVEESDLPEQYR